MPPFTIPQKYFRPYLLRKLIVASKEEVSAGAHCPCLQLGSTLTPRAKGHIPQGDDGWNVEDTGLEGEGIFQGAHGLKHSPPGRRTWRQDQMTGCPERVGSLKTGTRPDLFLTVLSGQSLGRCGKIPPLRLWQQPSPQDSALFFG